MGRKKHDKMDLTTAGLRARNAGKRMYDPAVDQGLLERLTISRPDLVLTEDEREARLRIMPATWLSAWRAGWSEASLEWHDLPKGETE
jgi:hypothetical protein